MIVSLLLLAAALVLILANGFFVAAEFGLVTVERADAERAAAAGDRRAGVVVKAVRELSFQLSGTQLGITVTSLVVGMLAEPALDDLIGPALSATGLPGGAVDAIAVVLGMLIASGVQMVVGELVPKNWAVARPLQVARFVAGPQHRFTLLFRPVIALLTKVANRIVRMLGVEPADELESARTPGELVSLARHSAQAGTLEQDTADLFVRTLALGRLTAQHVMTPRVKVSALQTDATAADVVNLTRATGLSRFPVYRDRIDEIVGMVHLKDALAVPAHRRLTTPVARIAEPALLVPETLPARQLLARLRTEQPIAAVVDEYGGTAGVVTIEDIVEELVGEVRDEHDSEGDGRPQIVSVPAEDARPAWEVDGSTRVLTLRRIGLDAPEGPYETLAGLVADLLGRIPVPGDRVELPGWRLSVRQVDRFRAERVKVVRTAAPSIPGGAFDGAPAGGTSRAEPGGRRAKAGDRAGTPAKAGARPGGSARGASREKKAGASAGGRR